MDQIVEWAKELQSLAQAGLFYGHDVYDKERYQRIREIAAEMMLMRADVPAEKITGLFCGDEGYQTPKVDTRAAIFRDGKILLVCEKGSWSMPGGWCEYNLSPAENVIKETKEEAGLDVSVKIESLWHSFVDCPGSQGAPELMRVHPANFQLPAKLTHTDFNSADFQALMGILQCHKQCGVVISTALQIVFQVNLRSSVEIYRSFLAAFSENDTLTSLEVNISTIQPY